MKFSMPAILVAYFPIHVMLGVIFVVAPSFWPLAVLIGGGISLLIGPTPIPEK
jgi:hypothetical protein